MINDAPASECNSVMKLKVFNDSEYLCLFATKDINPGDEILYDYGDTKNLWWRKKVNFNNFNNLSLSFIISSLCNIHR
jgi:SET domain-containing protein